ncbi:hypothetical protein ACFOKF_09830 [Sphingobium rhizovicinum]|uniref:Secreted protein n=1 Tax=Sphingobium rhizovicinum TaxID=432308 RepID=A0ABV7NDC6_9SPHN
MRRILLILASVGLLLSLGVAPVAHAVEKLGCVELADDGAYHSDNDGDQVPGDADNGYPHHHGGCHGHHVAPPLAHANAPEEVALNSQHDGRATRHLTPAPVGTTLRPPIA